MADRSKAPVEAIVENGEDAAPIGEVSAEPAAEATAAINAEEIAELLRDEEESDSDPEDAAENQAEAERKSEADAVADAEPADADLAEAEPAEAEPAEANSSATDRSEAEPSEAEPTDAAIDTATDTEANAAEAEADTAAEATPGVAPDPAAPQDEAPGVLLPAPVLHSGDRIADRYRLEECLTQAGVFTSWRAVDEKLRRAVGIHILASGNQRSQGAVAAAREAALLGDPRFVQVLDAVEDGELVYIIREWLPDATDLGTLLAEGPLEAYEAYQMVRQVTDAIASAHRRGLSHLRLTPSCVLRSDSGQYRINGIAMDAALHGLIAGDRADAELRDTQAIGALLFAALTQRWPYPEDRHGLQGMPRNVGLVPPEQVKAGVHRGLSDLCAQTLCPTPGRHLERLTSPEALAKAIDLMPKVRQPAPEPLTVPEYPPSSYSAPQHLGSRRPQTAPDSPPRRPGPAGPPPLPPALPGRTGRALKWGISLVLLAAIGLGSWGIAEALMQKPATTSGSTPGASASGASGSASPTPKAPQVLHIAGATEFSPLETPIAANLVPLAIDGNPTTAWITSQYDGYPNFGRLTTRAEGSGIIVDLGSVQSVSGVKITVPTSGQTMEVLAAPADAGSAPSDLSGYTQRIANSGVSTTSFDSALLATPVQTRYVLVHITSLPPDGTGHYRGGISEIQILG
ncbi:protein kinase family protein [Streptacidiphilus sp. EB129]|uniref:protein kinase family protein n=1 Tax=Streptacidiphilus sp. EB129 TaxID=3156262 RepID=UPI0035140406